MGNDTRRETRTLFDVMSQAIDGAMSDVHTAIPGEIVTYDATTNLATVKPLLKRKYKADTAPVSLPLIASVPIIFPRLGTVHLRLPVAPGSEGLLLFAERSIDRWLETGGEVDPQDSRRFALSDAMFIPGLSSKPNALVSKGAATSVELANGDAWIEITNDKKFKVTNSTNELFALISDLLQALLDARTNTTFGPQPLVPPSLFSTIKSKIDSMKG